jgi:NADH dehydrogenase FAD-containing subunit
MAEILILGGGFAGLIAAEKLSLGIRSEDRITLVSRCRQFTFYPALVRLAFGDCEPDDITFDLFEKLQRMDVRFVEGECVQIDPSNCRARIAGNDFSGDIEFDYLIIAMGRRLAIEKIGGLEHTHHLLGIKKAMEFGEAVRTFERGEIVVGLSPDAFLPIPVCETAFALARRFKEEIERKEISVTVIFPEHIRQAFGGARLSLELTRAFAKHGVRLLTKFAAREIKANELIGFGNKTIRYDLLMLVPPFRSPPAVDELEATEDTCFLGVDKYMRVRGLKNVYAAGDVTSFHGPKLASLAVRQAEVAAAFP